MIYDVTVPITNAMPVWPGDPPIQLQPKSHLSRDKSHTVKLTAIEMSSHTGTHLDAPYHMVEGGRRLNEIPLEQLTGKVAVINMPAVRSVGRKELESLKWNGIERVLFKTENSKHWQDGKFYEDFVYLEPEAAEFLVERAVRLVGIDYLSIDKYKSEKHPTHFVLLTRNVVVLEGLDLSRVPPGEYTLFALPLNLHEADGAPTRVILTN
jgi:arylformamidase